MGKKICSSFGEPIFICNWLMKVAEKFTDLMSEQIAVHKQSRHHIAYSPHVREENALAFVVDIFKGS